MIKDKVKLTALFTAEEAQKSVRGLEDSAVHAKYIELVRSFQFLDTLLLETFTLCSLLS